jgi:hypothetical protein
VDFGAVFLACREAMIKKLLKMAKAVSEQGAKDSYAVANSGDPRK